MRAPSRAAAVHALLCLATACLSATPAAAGPPAVAPEWLTPAESTDYRRTPTYDETMRYLRRLERSSRWVKVTSYGASAQGRDLPLVVVSRDRAFTPAAAARLGKPVVLVQACIHAGESEGKDAALALVRDLAVLRTRAELLDGAVLLIAPILSPDSHERRGPYHRINQNGPEEMGWRTTATGLNLNRDYMKAEAPEMRALLSQVFVRWRPHLLVDSHTTDGADYRHDITYGFNHGPTVPPPVERWLADTFEGRVVPWLTEMGHLPAPYLSFRGNYEDPHNGLNFGAGPPRLSNAYPPLHGRPAILAETHMLKPYGTRVIATYDLIVALLEELAARPRALLDAVAEAEAAIVARGREPDPARREVALTSRPTERATPFAYRGYVTRWEPSELSGGLVPRYTTTPWDTTISVYRELEPVVVVRQPVGYLVPREWTAVRDLFDLHGVRYRRFGRAWSDTVEVQRVARWETDAEIREGHHPIRALEVALERRLRTYRPGDLWVPLDQAAGLVAVHLCEAQAPDGLLFWNFFDNVLTPKEFADAYVMEPIARRMMAADTALAREFRQRVASDSSFARSPSRRLDFFYRRSPWADPEQAVLPVARALRRPPEGALEP